MLSGCQYFQKDETASIAGTVNDALDAINTGQLDGVYVIRLAPGVLAQQTEIQSLQ